MKSRLVLFLLILSAAGCAPTAQLPAPAPAVAGQATAPDIAASDPCEIEAQQKVAAAQQLNGADAALLLNPVLAIGIGLKTIQDHQAKPKLIERERQQCHQAADAAAAQQAQEARAREQEARNEQLDLQRGYRRISVDTFELDGRDLAAQSARVSISGAIIMDGNINVLFANGQTAMMATHSNVAEQNYPKVPLLIDSASRAFRQHLLTCQSSPASGYFGCSATVLGQATKCSLSNAFGAERELPCVAVDDGR